MSKQKYAAIAATLGWTEFEPQEDGLFLQPEEATAVNTALENATAVQTQLDEATASITSLNEQIATMHSAESVTALNDRIAVLEAENKELGKAASGNGSVVTAKEDVIETGAAKKDLTINDADHPVNQQAAAFLAAKKNAKASKPKY